MRKRRINCTKEKVLIKQEKKTNKKTMRATRCPKCEVFIHSQRDFLSQPSS